MPSKADTNYSRADFWPGQVVDLTLPRIQDIDFAMLAKRLSRIARFRGGTRDFYSVAEHSLRVADHVSGPAKPYALLHDAHEAFVGDMTRPTLQALQYAMFGKLQEDRLRCAVGWLTERWDAAIYAAAGLPTPTMEIVIEVKAADDRMCEAELTVLIHGERDAVLGCSNLCKSPEAAETDFMNALEIYAPDTAPFVKAWRTFNPKF